MGGRCAAADNALMISLIKMKYRKLPNQYNIRARFFGIRTNERLVALKLKKYCISLLLASRRCEQKKKLLLKKIGFIFFLKYLDIVLEPDYELERPLRLNRNIDSFTNSQCWNFFQFRKVDLYRLYNGFHFPERCILSNGINLHGEEIFLRGLYELVSGGNQFNVAENVFGRDQSVQSRSFRYFCDHLFVKCLCLVRNNL